MYYTTAQIRYRARKNIAALQEKSRHAFVLSRNSTGVDSRYQLAYSIACIDVRKEIERALTLRGKAFLRELVSARETLLCILARYDYQEAKNWEERGQSQPFDPMAIRAWRTALIDAIDAHDDWLA